MLKKTTNRKTIAITVLAVLLVALLAFNVTYAYFTDSTKSDVTMTFGVVDIQATGLQAVAASSAAVMPGDEIELEGTVTATNTTGNIWVQIAVPADSVVLKYDGVELEEGISTNMYYDNPGVDGTGFAYTEEKINAMKVQFAAILTSNLTAFINSTTGNTDLIGTNGVTAAAVDSSLSIDFSTATANIVIPANEFGNEWQKVTVTFSIAIKAIQADGVDRDEAIAAFAKADAEFNAGIFTADIQA